MTIQELIEHCEGLLRAGQLSEAAAKIKTAGSASIPRHLRMQVANICRRAQQDGMALRILSPVVRSDQPAVMQPKPEEIAEYAASLQKIGAINEAINLLENLDRTQVPSADLYLAFCLFRQWDYEAAIPHLQNYVKAETDGYKKLVGKVNLAAAMATSHSPEAHAVLDEAMAECQAGQHTRLLSNCHEMRAQLAITAGDFQKAREELTQARKLLPQGFDAFFVRKWSAIVNSMETKDETFLMNLATAAEQQGDWECLRDVDFFRLKLKFDQQLLNRLVFGTPFGAYRARVQRDLNAPASNESFLYGAPGAPCFDAGTGDFIGGKIKYPGKTLHQLIAILLSDFYKPWSLGEIFSQLFPREYYNPFSSANRVHQLLWRLRKWLGDNQIPVRLAEHNGKFNLRIEGNFSFLVPLSRVQTTQHALEIHKIKLLFGSGQWFLLLEVRNRLNMSSATFKRLASWAVRERLFVRAGQGRATIYRIAG